MTSDTHNRTEACALVFSEIIHTRHGHPAHHLQKAGFSILIDLDRLDEAHNASWFFSVNKFNIVSFHETDFGPNHKSQRKANEPKISIPLHPWWFAQGKSFLIKIRRVGVLCRHRL